MVRFIARRGRICWTNAARSVAAIPAVRRLHAVTGSRGGGGKDEEKLLASCYRTALDLAAGNALTSIAYPAISTGIYRFPADFAARIAVGTVAAEIAAKPRGMTRVTFCCFSRESAEHHKNTFAELGLV